MVSLTLEALRRPEPTHRRTAHPDRILRRRRDLLAKVEEALAGHEAGDELQIQLEPEHAFGDYKPDLVCFENRSLFPEQLEAGMTFEGLPEGAATPDMPADTIYVVTEVYPSHVVLDGNTRGRPGAAPAHEGRGRAPRHRRRDRGPHGGWRPVTVMDPAAAGGNSTLH